MNSYPPELYAQLYPLMFVAGLGRAPGEADLPDTRGEPLNPFADLYKCLKDTFLAQKPSFSVWRETNKLFNVVFVDKGVRFPPRKDSATTSSHSPLSPLTSSSPLYPDGLIAPIWVRKHILLVPAVFVLFLLLPETPPPTSPLEGSTYPSSLASLDAALAQEINVRKKQCSERQIKLTVVLITTRRMLDDPALDARLSAIRRQSSLDSRAALFVLSPVSPSELVEFIGSLQSALLPAATEYYTSHSKRVRRKKGGLPSPSSHYLNPSQPALPPAGWSIRYEYKQACFAELRGESEVALKHFLQALFFVSEYLSASVAPGVYIVPPRTKRWAEAKVLADCISIKVLARHLSPPAAPRLTISHFNTHMSVFSNLSRMWGMSEDGWEYWSWRSRQYRILADLLTTVPSPAFAFTFSSSYGSGIASEAGTTSSGSRQSLEEDGSEESGVNPTVILSHPAFYYLLAAECIMTRRLQFLETKESTNPSYLNEKKVDHLGIALELYTKAYEMFKEYSTEGKFSGDPRDRFAIHVAFKIARVYLLKDDCETAMKFFPRIAQKFRLEGTQVILEDVLLSWQSAIRRAADVETGLGLTIELASNQSYNSLDSFSIPVKVGERSDLQDDLLILMQSATPSTPHLTLLSSAANALFTTTALFYYPTISIREPVPFQVAIRGPPNSDISRLPFKQLEMRLYLLGAEGEVAARTILIKHNSACTPSLFTRLGSFSIGDSNPIQLESYLMWEVGTASVWTGSVTCESPGELTISSVTITMQDGPWHIIFPLGITQNRDCMWFTPLHSPFSCTWTQPRRTCNVTPEAHNIHIELSHPDMAYLDDPHSIKVSVKNADERPFHLTLDILLAPRDDSTGDDCLLLGGVDHGRLVKGEVLGFLEPGQVMTKEFYLICKGTAGDRTLDVSVRSGVSVVPSSTDEHQELLRTVIISTQESLSTVSRATYYLAQPDNISNSFADRQTLWHSEYYAEFSIEMVCHVPDILLLGIDVVIKEGYGYRHKSSSIELADFPLALSAGESFSFIFQIEASDGRINPGSIIPGSMDVKWQRDSSRDVSESNKSHFAISFPLLPQVPHKAVAFLHAPLNGYLHRPSRCSLDICNLDFSLTADIQLQLEATDGFIVAGLRQGQLAVIPPRSTTSFDFDLIPILCGFQSLPRIEIWNQRSLHDTFHKGTPDRDKVPIIDPACGLYSSSSDQWSSNVLMCVLPHADTQ